MNWIAFCLLGNAMFTVANFLDKYAVDKAQIDHRSLPILGSVTAIIFGTFFWVGCGFPILPTEPAARMMIAGALTLFGIAAYFKAISNDEVSKIIIFLRILPVFTLLLSTMILGEKLDIFQIAGFVLILFSTLGVSLKLEDRKLKMSSSFRYIALACIFFAVSQIIYKNVFEDYPFSHVVAYESWGLAIGGLILYLFMPETRKAFNSTCKSISRTGFYVVWLNEGIVTIAGKLLIFCAYATGPVSLISVLGGTSIFFGIVFSLILSLFIPGIYKEDLSAGELSKKIGFSIVLIAGIWLLYRN